MKKIITNKKGEKFEVLIDEQDAHLFEEYAYHILKGEYTNYVARKTSRKLGKRRIIRLHNDIMKTPKGMVVDHLNKNGLDNRRENLQIVTHMENTARGDSAISKSGFKGVCFDKTIKKNPFKVSAWIEGKQKHLGLRPTRISAARFHDEVVEKIDGNSSRTNKARNKELFDKLTEEENLGIPDSFLKNMKEKNKKEGELKCI